MYENLKQCVRQYEEKRMAEFDTWFTERTVGEILSTPYLRSLLTKRTYEVLQKANPTSLPDQSAAEKIIEKKHREIQKRSKVFFSKLDDAEQSEVPNSIDILVEFKRHPIWNYNPVATVTAGGIATKGHASGCGYDKESEAVANAMNQNPGIMKILYDYAEIGGVFSYGVTTINGVPSFVGGVGVNWFRSVFEDCGYRWKDMTHENKNRYYYLTK